ncbi:MAG: YIP1 family protein [Xenococcaceae cyanobacterium]
MAKNRKQGLWRTLGKALSLQAEFYENARNNSQARRIALTIVILAALSHTLGSAVISAIERVSLPYLLPSLIINFLSVLAGYYVWTWVIWKLGQWLKPIDPTYRDLSIPIGFAYAPQTLNFLTLIPLLGRPIQLILAVWSLLAVIVAVRQGLDLSTFRSAVICVIGWTLIQLAIGSIQIQTISFNFSS